MPSPQQRFHAPDPFHLTLGCQLALPRYVPSNTSGVLTTIVACAGLAPGAPYDLPSRICSQVAKEAYRQHVQRYADLLNLDHLLPASHRYILADKPPDLIKVLRHNLLCHHIGRGRGFRRLLLWIAGATCSRFACVQAVFKCQDGGKPKSSNWGTGRHRDGRNGSQRV